MTTAGRGDRRRPELRARGVAGLGGRASPRRLDPASYDVVPLTIGRDGTWRDRGRPADGAGRAAQVLRGCDVVFPVVHGPRGEDGTLAALCDLAGIPYVGSGVGAGALAMDKWATKLVAEAVGIATAPGHAGHRRAPRDAVPWTGPVVVKPVAAGSSLRRHAGPRARARCRPALDGGPRPRRPRAGRGRRRGPRDRRRRPAPRRRVAAGPARPWRSWSTGSSTTTPSTTAAPTSASRPPLDRDARRRPRGRRGRDVRRPRVRRGGPRRLLPDRGRPRAQRGEHDARDDRALAGAADVRRRRAVVRRAARRAGRGAHPVTPRWFDCAHDLGTDVAVRQWLPGRAGRCRRPRHRSAGSSSDDLVVTSLFGGSLVVVGDRLCAVSLVPSRSRAPRWPSSGSPAASTSSPAPARWSSRSRSPSSRSAAPAGAAAVVWLSGVSIPLGAASRSLLARPDVLYDALDSAGVQVLARRAYDGTTAGDSRPRSSGPRC